MTTDSNNQTAASLHLATICMTVLACLSDLTSTERADMFAAHRRHLRAMDAFAGLSPTDSELAHEQYKRQRDTTFGQLHDAYRPLAVLLHSEGITRADLLQMAEYPDLTPGEQEALYHADIAFRHHSPSAESIADIMLVVGPELTAYSYAVNVATACRIAQGSINILDQYEYDHICYACMESEINRAHAARALRHALLTHFTDYNVRAARVSTDDQRAARELLIDALDLPGFSVNFWGGVPHEADNCWAGDDYIDGRDALAAFREPASPYASDADTKYIELRMPSGIAYVRPLDDHSQPAFMRTTPV